MQFWSLSASVGKNCVIMGNLGTKVRQMTLWLTETKSHLFHVYLRIAAKFEHLQK